MEDVLIIYGNQVDAMVQRLIEKAGAFNRLRPDDRVVIKPNLVTAMSPEDGMTTDPLVVKAVIDLCMSMRTSTITIAEGSATCETELAFEKAGYSDLVSEYNIKFVDLNKAPTKNVEIPGGKGVKSLKIPTIIPKISSPRLTFSDSEICGRS